MSDAADLSSMATDLNEIARRVAGMAEAHERARREDVSSALHEAERAVRAGVRHLAVAVKALEKH